MAHFIFIDLIKKIQLLIHLDGVAISERFKKFVYLNTPAIFMEHADRAQAFVTCCELNIKPNEKLLKEYVDNYHSFGIQMNMIESCAVNLLGSDKNSCDASIEKLISTKSTIRE